MATWFQSRNRDACHVRRILDSMYMSTVACFNLAIEMLVISGQHTDAFVFPFKFQSRNRDACHFRASRARSAANADSVSISQSRCLSFQGLRTRVIPVLRVMRVSISQSRCLSFQVTTNRERYPSRAEWFQSRNRDACHFRAISTEPRPRNLFQSRNRDACHFR